MTSKQRLAIEITGKILYILLCFLFFQISIILGSHVEGPSSEFLQYWWILLSSLPGVIGFTGIVVGPIVICERWL